MTRPEQSKQPPVPPQQYGAPRWCLAHQKAQYRRGCRGWWWVRSAAEAVLGSWPAALWSTTANPVATDGLVTAAPAAAGCAATAGRVAAAVINGATRARLTTVFTVGFPLRLIRAGRELVRPGTAGRAVHLPDVTQTPADLGSGVSGPVRAG